MENKPCYWWVDSSLPINEQKFLAICIPCFQNIKESKKPTDNYWFWEKGYGNFDINCHYCHEIINKGEDE